MQIKIKQEKFSDSEEEAAHKKSLIVKKREDDCSSGSESSGDDTDSSGEHQLRNVKKEKITSGSSSSSSGSDSHSHSSDDSSSENGDLLLNRIKKEKDDDSSFAVPFSPIVSRPIKSEPMSDFEGGKSQKNATKKKAHGERSLSISEHLDSFLADAIKETTRKNSENGSAKRKRKPTMLDETNLTDLTAKFQSPAMSSTLMPNASVSESPTPAKVKKEVQSEDERPKKKKTKSSANQSLENMESELFKSYTG